jgi:hypothetical protein
MSSLVIESFEVVWNKWRLFCHQKSLSVHSSDHISLSIIDGNYFRWLDCPSAALLWQTGSESCSIQGNLPFFRIAVSILTDSEFDQSQVSQNRQSADGRRSGLEFSLAALETEGNSQGLEAEFH